MQHSLYKGITKNQQEIMKKSQREIIENQLLRYGKVSRNWALRRYISRLSGIIFDLKEKYVIEGEWLRTKKGNDYIYKFIKIK